MLKQVIAPELMEALPGFRDGIDLWDETLREGAERAAIAPSLDEKTQVAIALSDIGVRSIVVGMFPDVPHNIELLKALIQLQQQGRIRQDVRFLVISHVGAIFERSLEVLSNLGLPIDSVWLIVIHSVSDQQIQHLFPSILQGSETPDFDPAAWQEMGDQQRRDYNVGWLEQFLPSVKHYQGGGIVFGLLDYFRSDLEHARRVIRTLANVGVGDIRLVDTAGSCTPHEVGQYVAPVIAEFPDIRFYGHFHDDFGMATGNAILGLSYGLKGVDVSVGGFANRAGHPAIAEVAVALRDLYDIELKGFNYQGLCELSRRVEQLYGLMETPTQAITGVITHGILSGIRTELIAKAPTIFDIVEPESVGANLTRMFGVRSGRDGMFRFLKANERELGLPEVTREMADRLFEVIQKEWSAKSQTIKQQLGEQIKEQQELLRSAAFTEEEMKVMARKHIEIHEKELCSE